MYIISFRDILTLPHSHPRPLDHEIGNVILSVSRSASVTLSVLLTRRTSCQPASRRFGTSKISKVSKILFGIKSRCPLLLLLLL
eukprot:GSChrysophyteH1.ASY1.ANO1.1505.1 assembled CDS